MRPAELIIRAAALRAQARALIEEADQLEAAASHATDPHCANCGHPLSAHNDDDDDADPERACLHHDLSGDCYCQGYVKSAVPRKGFRGDTRR